MSPFSKALHRVRDALTGYFLIEGSPIPLAMFRFMLGITVMYEASHNFRRISYYTPDTFHFPYLKAISPLPIGDLARETLQTAGPDALLGVMLANLAWPDTIEMLFAWEFVFGALLAVGLLTRLGAVGVLLTQGYALFICQLNFRNHIYLLLLLVLIVLFSPANKALSFDALFRRFLSRGAHVTKARWVPLMTQRLVGLQLVIMYFWAAVHKLQPGSLTGYPVGRAVSRAIKKASFSNWALTPEQVAQLSEIFADPEWQPLFGHLTVLTEGFLAIGLLIPQTRLAAVFVGIGLHFGIFATMDIRTFGLLSVSAYICFWLPRSRAIPIVGVEPQSEVEPAKPTQDA